MSKKIDKIWAKLDSENNGQLWKVKDGIFVGYTDDFQLATFVRNRLNEYYGDKGFQIVENESPDVESQDIESPDVAPNPSSS